MDATTTTAPAVRVIERMLHEGFGAGNTVIVDELCAADIVEHQFGLSGQGQEAIAKIKKGISDVHAAFPDLTFTVEGFVEHGDTVWVRAHGTGTNSGPFFGPPTGKSVAFTVFDVARVVDGKIVEHWGVPDRFEILARLGRL